METKETMEKTESLFSKESHPFSRLMNKGKFFSGRISDIEANTSRDSSGKKVFDIHEASVVLPKETSDKAINMLKAEIDVDKETNQVAQFSLLFTLSNYQTTDEEKIKRLKEEFKDYIKLESLNSDYGDYFNFSIRFPVSAIFNKSFILNAEDYTLNSEKFIELFDYAVTTLLEQFRITVVRAGYKLNELTTPAIKRLFNMVVEYTFWRYNDKYGLQNQESETITRNYTSFPLMKNSNDKGAFLTYDEKDVTKSEFNRKYRNYTETKTRRNWLLPNDFSPFQYNSFTIKTITGEEDNGAILMQAEWVFLFDSLDDIKHLLDVNDVIESVVDKTKEPNVGGPIRIRVGIRESDFLKINNHWVFTFPVESFIESLSRDIVACVKDSIIEHNLFNLKGEELNKKVKLIESKLAELRDNTLGIKR